MTTSLSDLEKIQQLSLDIIAINRNHYIPDTERHENVAEHSFSMALLCWKLFEEVNPPLDLSKILKYAISHDFAERGLEQDTSAYASAESREEKYEREAAELERIKEEFSDFSDLGKSIEDYEAAVDEEALFVYSVDKMQAAILGSIDDWRPYAEAKITYEDFCEKNEGYISNKCSPYLKEVFTQVYEDACKTYYDQPEN